MPRLARALLIVAPLLLAANAHADVPPDDGGGDDDGEDCECGVAGRPASSGDLAAVLMAAGVVLFARRRR
jgi:MYXO-CTERM domain-containing protein